MHAPPPRSPQGRFGHSPLSAVAAVGPELPLIAVADAMFEEIRASGTETRAPELTDRHLECLAFVFGEGHLANALELAQTGRVKKLVAERSGRSCFQVRGRSGAKEEYLVLPRHYCSCRAFQWDVVSRCEKVICKHQLAARLAEASGAHATAIVGDLLMAQLLEAYGRGDEGGARNDAAREWGRR